MSNKYLDIAMEKVIKQEVNTMLDKIRAEIIDKYMTATGEVNQVAKGCLQIIDKYRVDEPVGKPVYDKLMKEGAE